MSKLNLNCVLTFFLFHSEFQNLSSGRMIVCAEERNDLYYLSGLGPSFGRRFDRNVSISAVSNSDVMLWH